jgi:hypothetical protein
MTRTIFAATILAAALASGCGTARHVVRHQHLGEVRGGAIRVEGGIVEGTMQAHVEMTEACRGRWELLSGADAVAMRSTVIASKGTGEPAAEVAAIDPDRDLVYACARR